MYLVYGKYKTRDRELTTLAERYSVTKDLLFTFPLLSKLYRVVEATPANFDDYRFVHSNEYVETLSNIDNTGREQGGITPEVVKFEKVGVGGTLQATNLALSECCIAYHLGGGYHHGLANGPNLADYCNDVAIALRRMISSGMERVLYVDLDVHHPDGVQQIFESDPRVLQISLHESSRSPKSLPSFTGSGRATGSKINMPIPAHTGDLVYLHALRTIVTSVMRSYRPQAVFYQAGVDSHHKDVVGNLNLSLRGLYKRDVLISTICRKQGIPFVAVLGGGYNLQTTSRAIVNTLAALAGKSIVFDEVESYGATTAHKLYRWYGSLRDCLRPYLELDQLPIDEGNYL